MQPSHRRRFFELPALCIATVIASSATTLSTKAAYQTKIDGVPFSKPFFMELLVGLAMTTSLLAVPCRPKLPRRGRSWFRHLLPLLPLAVSDLLVGLADCGAILFAPASIISITNCSILCFSAVATRLVLKARYSYTQWAGILLAAIGVSVVGAASLTGGHDDPLSAMAPFGVGLALGARALQSLQFAHEERFMKGGRFSPLLQVGAEGMIESLLCGALVLPLVAVLPGGDHGRVEDTLSTLRMLRKSPFVSLMCALTFVSLAALNPLSMAIGKLHGSVLRVFVDVGRPAVVWAVSLLAFKLSGGRYGEGWTPPKSWIELCGFATLFGGLALYVYGDSRAGRSSKHHVDEAVVGESSTAGGDSSSSSSCLNGSVSTSGAPGGVVPVDQMREQLLVAGGESSSYEQVSAAIASAMR